MGLSLNEIAKNDPRLLEPLELFAACKVNCLQAVIMPFMKDLPTEVAEALMNMTGGLGGGLAGMGYVCGALLGGTMALGQELTVENFSGEDGERFQREFIQKFGRQHGSHFCSGIKALADQDQQYEACQVVVVSTIEAVDAALLSLKNGQRLTNATE